MLEPPQQPAETAADAWHRNRTPTYRPAEGVLSQTRESLIMSFVRTILGDLSTSELGRCSAHEHIIIDGLLIAERHPDFLLDDIEAACVDLREFREAQAVDGLSTACPPAQVAAR